MECLCGEDECRGRVSGADLLTHHVRWDAEVRTAMESASRVAQPLEPALLDPLGLRRILERRRAVPSLVDVYLPPERRSRLDAATAIEPQRP